MPHKTEIRCFKRWLYLKEIGQINPSNTKNVVEEVEALNIQTQLSSCQWTSEEDAILKAQVEKFGTQNWVIIARFLPGRLGRQCRERWHNVIDPSIVRRDWTQEEDMFILQMH